MTNSRSKTALILSPGRRLRPGRLEAAALVAIVLLAVGLRAYHLGYKSLWLDELNMVRSADGHGFLFRRFGGAILGHPPTYLFLLRVVMLTLGREEWMLRLPAMIASVASIPALWMLGRKLFGPAVGLMAALLLTLSPMHVAYGQEAHSYGLYCLLSILLLWALVRAAEAEVNAIARPESQEDAGQPRRARWLPTWGPFILLATLNLYVHYYSVYLVGLSALLFPLFVLDTGGGGLASLWREPARRRMLLRLLAALATVVVLYLPQIVGIGNSVGYADQVASAAQQKSLVDVMNRTLVRLMGTVVGNPLAKFPILVVFSAGLVWLVWRRRPLGIAWLLILILPLPPTLLFTYLTGVEFSTRRVIFMLPVLVLLAAVGVLALVELAGWLWRRASVESPNAERAAAQSHRVMAVVAAVAVIAIMVFSVHSLVAYYRTPKQDFKGAGRALAAHAKPADAVVAPQRTARNLSWYYPQVKLIEGDLGDALEALCRLQPRVYLALMPDERMSSETGQWINQQFVEVPLKNIGLYYRNCNAGSDGWYGTGASGLFDLAYDPQLPYLATQRAAAQYEQLAAQHGDSVAQETAAVAEAPTPAPAMPAIEPTSPSTPAAPDQPPATPSDSPRAKAEALLRAGQADKALDIFQAIVQDNPNDRAGHMGLAAALAAAGRTNEALDEYKRIERTWPGFPWAYIQRGVLLESLGQERTALKEYRASTQSDHGDADAYFVLGFTFLRLEQQDEAIAQFQAGLALDPSREGPRKALEKLQQQP